MTDQQDDYDNDRQCEHLDDYGLQCSELGRWHPDDQMYLCVDCRGDWCWSE